VLIINPLPGIGGTKKDRQRNVCLYRGLVKGVIKDDMSETSLVEYDVYLIRAGLCSPDGFDQAIRGRRGDH
jgi:hypothetical protein